MFDTGEQPLRARGGGPGQGQVGGRHHLKPVLGTGQLVQDGRQLRIGSLKRICHDPLLGGRRFLKLRKPVRPFLVGAGFLPESLEPFLGPLKGSTLLRFLFRRQLQLALQHSLDAGPECQLGIQSR